MAPVRRPLLLITPALALVGLLAASCGEPAEEIPPVPSASGMVDSDWPVYVRHRNGEELWQADLPAGGQATPMTFEVDGRQHVVIAAGGHRIMGTTPGDYVVAFALPEETISRGE
jgi:glucose dehydrogenase